MNKLVLVTITACAATALVLQSPLLHHDSASTATAADGATRSPQVGRLASRTWRGLSLRVPAAWKQVAATDDHATWASADRRQTVTLGAALDPHGDVTPAARAAAPAIAAAAPGGRVTEVRQLSAQAASVRVQAGSGPLPLRLEQTWTRIEGVDLVAIVSWTSSSGSWPPARPA